AACSSNVGPSDSTEKTGNTDEAIIGGVAADSPTMNAVGSLVTISRYNSGTSEIVYYSYPFCSGTLIGPTAVITAKHCTQAYPTSTELGFAIGPNGKSPTKVLP